ncbi:Catenin-beta-like protein [Coemansia spiralis]|nr:Catenin-beta-like protein [Coemansia spiralis]
MDINDIFKETVITTSLNVAKNKRKLGAAPSLRELKEGGYGVIAEAEEAAKRKRPNSNSELDVDTMDRASTYSENEGDDDEGGRFFSDGLTTQEKGVMSWVDHMEELEDSLDHASVQRLILRLERAVSKNTQDRIKHAQSPEGFAESEAELDEAIQRMQMLVNDVQHLKIVEELDAVPTLVGLMAHENADISLDVIQLVVELTAEDAWSQEGESSEERATVVGFVTALAKNEFFEMLGQNLFRLNEAAESLEGEADRQGVFQTLSLIENLVSLDIQLAERAIVAMKLLPWLQQRITQANFVLTKNTLVDSNQQYAAEIASILLQSSSKLCEQIVEQSLFMDALLNCLAKYRKRTPSDDIETEYLENIIDSICMLVAKQKGKAIFIELEGVELLVLLQKQQQYIGRLLSVKILDYALSPPPSLLQGEEDGDDNKKRSLSNNEEARTIAKRYIDNMGLKYLFSLLMHRGKGSVQKLFKKHPETDGHVISCIAWLLRLTDREAPAHWRVLAKFVPSATDASSWKSYVDRISELNIAYYERVKEAEGQFDMDSLQIGEESDEEGAAENRYLSRMDTGLFSLQMTDIIIAFIVDENPVKERIEKQLRRKGRSIRTVYDELCEYLAAKRAKSLAAAAVADTDEFVEGSEPGAQISFSDIIPLL